MTRRSRRRKREKPPSRYSSSILLDYGNGNYYIWSRNEPTTRIGGFERFHDAYTELQQLLKLAQEQRQEQYGVKYEIVDPVIDPIAEALAVTSDVMHRSTPDELRQHVHVAQATKIRQRGYRELYWLHADDYRILSAIGQLDESSRGPACYGMQAFYAGKYDRHADSGLPLPARVGKMKRLKTLEAADMEARYMLLAGARTRFEIDDGIITLDDWITYDDA